MFIQNTIIALIVVSFFSAVFFHTYTSLGLIFIKKSANGYFFLFT